MALTTVPASLSATAITLTTAAQPNITSVGTLTGLTVSGNIAGTLTTAAQTNITSVGTLTGLTLSGNLTVNANTNITGNLTVDTNSFYVDATNNRVGIGTTSPVSPLTINGTDPLITFENGEAPHWQLGFENTQSDRFVIYDNNASSYRLIIDSIGNSTFAGNLDLADDKILRLGDSDEFQIYHTSSGNSIISETGGGSLYLDGSNIYLRKSTASGEAMADFVADGAVTLYHNGSAKLATATGGVDITGDLTVSTSSGTALTLSGNFPRLYFVDTSGSDLDAYIVNNANGLFFGKTNSPTASNDIMMLDLTNQRVGIGGNPDKTFHIKTSVINTAFARIESTATNSYPTLSLKNDAREYQLTAHGGVSDSFVIYDGTAGANRLKIETNGNPTFQGNNHTNLQVKSGDDSVAAFLQTVQGSDARFGTSSNHQLNIATNGQFRLSIKNTGQVGIGITDPTQKLDVRGGSGAGTLTHAIFTGTSSRGLEIRTRSDTSGGQNSGTAEINSADSEGTGGDLAFSSNGNVRMFIDGGGSVGIGTTNPTRKLHIISTGSATYSGSSAGSNIALHLGNAESGAAGRTIGMSMSSESNAEVYLNCVTSSNNNGGDFVIASRNGGTRGEKLRIYAAGHQVQQMDGKKFFKLTDEFTASANSTTNFKINVSDYTGASSNGYCFYTVTVMGYASGGANGLNFTYTSAGYSGHNYSSINYNSYGAGTIANGASGGTQYTNVGLSYHPAVNLGGYIASGSVWVYVPAAQQYGVTVVNTAGTGMACFLTIEGWST